MLRVWQRYFNDRFQTYGRNVHFYVFYASGRGSPQYEDPTPERRRSDAIGNLRDVRPFSVVTVQRVPDQCDAILPRW
jgi:hypothetical protein